MGPNAYYPTTDPLPEIAHRFEQSYLKDPGLIHAWSGDEVRKATRAIASKIYLKDFVAMSAMWEYEVVITYYYDACKRCDDMKPVHFLVQQMCCLIDGGGRWIRRYNELKQASGNPEHPAYQPEQPKELGSFLVIAQKYDRRYHTPRNRSIESALRILRPYYPPPKHTKKGRNSVESSSYVSLTRPITPRPQIELDSLRNYISTWDHN